MRAVLIIAGWILVAAAGLPLAAAAQPLRWVPRRAVQGPAQRASSVMAVLDRQPPLSPQQRRALQERLGNEGVPLAERFALQVSLGTGRSLPTGRTVSGVPVALLAAARTAYPHLEAAGLQGLIRPLFDEGARFDRVWAGYQRHAGEVNALLQQAANAGATELTERLLLDAMVPLPVDAEGAVPPGRGMIEALDADVPLIRTLGEIASERGNRSLLYRLAGELRGRRRVGQESDERLLWLARNHFGRTGSFFNGSVPPMVRHAGRELLAALERETHAPGRLAASFLGWVDDRAATVVEPGAAAVSRRSWVRMRLSGANVGVHRARYRREQAGERRTVDLRVRFAEEAPFWAQGRAQAVWIVARVRRAGRRMDLRRGFVVDLRWLDAADEPVIRVVD